MWGWEVKEGEEEKENSTSVTVGEIPKDNLAGYRFPIVIFLFLGKEINLFFNQINLTP